MFKMGCSMAKRILAIDRNSSSGEPSSSSSSGAGSSKKSKDKQFAASGGSSPGNRGGGGPGFGGEQSSNNKQINDDLGDFSQLKEDPRIPLNVRQIFKIAKSWKAIARTMSNTGTAMFLNLFEQNKDLFYLFDRFQHLKGEDLHESMELREHAATVMSTLDQSISSLCDYDNFVTYLHSIGKLHRKVPGFKREHFWKIEQPFLKAVKRTLDERCNETIEEIYKIAIKLIIETIADGYGEDQDEGTAATTTTETTGFGGNGNDHQGQAGSRNGGNNGGDSGGGRSNGNSSNAGDNNNGSKTRDRPTGKGSGSPRGNSSNTARQQADGLVQSSCRDLVTQDFHDNEVKAANCGREATEKLTEASGANHCSSRGNISPMALGSGAATEPIQLQTPLPQPIVYNKALEVCSSETTAASSKTMRGTRTREQHHNISGYSPEGAVGESARLKVLDCGGSSADGGIILAADSGADQSDGMASNVAHDDAGGCSDTLDETNNKSKQKEAKATAKDLSSQLGTLFALSRLLPALVPTTVTGESPAIRDAVSLSGEKPALIIEGTCPHRLGRSLCPADIAGGSASAGVVAQTVAVEEMGGGSLINCSQFDRTNKGAKQGPLFTTQSEEALTKVCPHKWSTDRGRVVMRDERIQRNLDCSDGKCEPCNQHINILNLPGANGCRLLRCPNDKSALADCSTELLPSRVQRQSEWYKDNTSNATKTNHSSIQLIDVAAQKTSKFTSSPSDSQRLIGRFFQSIKKTRRSITSHKPSGGSSPVEKVKPAVAQTKTHWHNPNNQYSLSSDPNDLVELIKMLMLTLATTRGEHNSLKNLVAG